MSNEVQKLGEEDLKVNARDLVAEIRLDAAIVRKRDGFENIEITVAGAVYTGVPALIGMQNLAARSLEGRRVACSVNGALGYTLDLVRN